MSLHQTLRPYQIKGINDIRKEFSKGHRKVLLYLATGGGKTTVFSEILKQLAEKGNKGAMVVRGRKLVDQGHKRLLRENVPHGVIMNGHWNVNKLAPVQVCSIDTMISRDLIPQGKLLVIDEAHLFTSDTCIKFCEDFLAQNAGSFILAVTATPHSDKSLSHLADVVVKPTSMNELIDQGFLVPAISYAPIEVDTSDVRVSRTTKDYVTADLEQILNGSDIVGNIVNSWKNFAQDRSTLTFGVSINHSKHLTEIYNKAGIKWRHCDADSSDNEREDCVGELEQGLIKGISNVGIFCTGVDIPSLGCVQLARPTKSYNLYIQMAGRGTRPFAGKDDFILLDNAGNVLRHGFITDEPECSITPVKQEDKKVMVKTCKKCFAVFNQFDKCCPQCGAVNPIEEKERMASSLDGTLTRIDDMPIEAKCFQRHKELKKIRKEKGYRRGWIYHCLLVEFGEELATKYCPRREKPAWV